MSEDDRRYLRQRAEAEAKRAAQAPDPHVASLHSQMAAAYRDRLGATVSTKRLDA